MTAFDLGEAFEAFDQPVGRMDRHPEDTERAEFGFVDALTLAVRHDGVRPRIRVAIDGGATIWGRAADGPSEGGDGVPFDHHAFLDFFATNWAALWLERLPANVDPGVFGWGSLTTSEEVESKERWSPSNDWIEFQARHCVSSLMLAAEERETQLDWWLVASDDTLWLVVPDQDLRYRVPLGQGMKALERCCDHLARWIHAEGTHPDLVECWTGRRRAARTQIASLYMGVTDRDLVEDAANDLGGDGIAQAFHHTSPVLAVARMRPAYVGPDDLRLLFSEIRRTEPRETPALDRLAERAILEVCNRPSFDRVPLHQQGRRVALWLRSILGVADDAMVDPLRFLRDHDVSVTEVTLSADAIDAIAFWGGGHGPGVVTNTRGRHAGSIKGRRTTLAHEICHCLIDRGSRLPLVDVVGGRVPEGIEKRARAFAAELLLPQQRAYEAFVAAGELACGHEDLTDIVVDLMATYNASQFVAAHQLHNAIKDTSTASRETLTPILSYIQSLTRRRLD